MSGKDTAFSADVPTAAPLSLFEYVLSSAMRAMSTRFMKQTGKFAYLTEGDRGVDDAMQYPVACWHFCVPGL